MVGPGGRIQWLRENISFFNTTLLVLLMFVAAGRYYGTNENRIENMSTTLKTVETKVDTTIKQGVDTGVSIVLLQRDIKDAATDISEMRSEIADMKTEQRRQGDALADLTNRVGVLENRQNKR